MCIDKDPHLLSNSTPFSELCQLCEIQLYHVQGCYKNTSRYKFHNNKELSLLFYSMTCAFKQKLSKLLRILTCSSCSILFSTKTKQNKKKGKKNRTVFKRPRKDKPRMKTHMNSHICSVKYLLSIRGIKQEKIGLI